MADNDDSGLDEFHAIRKPGAHLEEQVVPDDFVPMLRADLNAYQQSRPRQKSIDGGRCYIGGTDGPPLAGSLILRSLAANTRRATAPVREVSRCHASRRA
jgi:hypothetical protein